MNLLATSKLIEARGFQFDEFVYRISFLNYLACPELDSLSYFFNIKTNKQTNKSKSFVD
jgi:hypothetical protein